MIILPRYPQLIDAAGKAAQSAVPTVTITHVKNGTFSVTFRGTNGAVIYCDPGDGSAVQEKTLLGVGTNVVFSCVNDGTERVVVITGTVLALTRFYAPNTMPVAVDLSDAKNLNYIWITSGTLSDIISIENLVNLETLCLQNCNIVDISALSNLTSLKILSAYNNNIVDISPVFSLPGLTTLNIKNNPAIYITQTWPAWSGVSYNLGSTVTTSAEVDQMLIDAAAGGVHDTPLYLDGTNPARTSVSDAAIITLLINGVELHVNE